MTIVPTLNFGGNCGEALDLYAAAFGGEIACRITYREADDPAYNPLLRENQRDCIYHAELKAGGSRIIMSDQVEGSFATCYGNFLTLMFDTKEEVQVGSETIYPMEATPYSSCRVVFVDRFGIRWGLMTKQTEK